jgi:hypothetical protein
MQTLQKTHFVSIDKNRIEPDPVDILRLLGDQQDSFDANTAGLVEQYIAESLKTSLPEGVYILTEALESKSAGELRIPGKSFDTGKIIQKMLRHSEHYAFFLSTAGPGPEMLARTLMNQGSYLEGYIVDLAASAIVDLAADQIQEQVREHARSMGLQITNRYSPGYCSWDVKEQQKLFSLFPDGCCSISLSESSLMDPIKSISGIIGLGAGVHYQEYICEICPMKDCLFRRVGHQ